MRTDQSRLRVVDYHVARLHRRDLSVEVFCGMTSIHICIVAEFEDFAALNETKLAPAAMRESDDWI